MSRQLEQKGEDRERERQDRLVRALEFGIVGSLKAQGIELHGIAIVYELFNCLITLKAEVDMRHIVAFVGSDTMMNAILKADAMAASETLKWRPDKYRADNV